MDAYILRIDPLNDADNGYPISLIQLADDDDASELTVLARDTIPKSLKRDGMAAPIDKEVLRESLANHVSDDDSLSRLGEQLAALLLPASIADQLPANNARILLDIRAEELRSVPWELLRRNDKPSFGNDRTAFCRGGPLLKAESHRRADPWPMRILVVIGTSDPVVGAQAELELIQDALVPSDPDVDLEILRQPTLQRLRDKLKEYQPHVFHFVGHGRAEEIDGKSDTFLELDPGTTVERWTFDNIVLDMQDAPDLLLAYLNACRTGTATSNEAWNIGNAFLKAGTPAVVSMLVDVAGGKAGEVAGAFYRELVSGMAVDVALARARRRADSVRSREFYAPCLDVRQRPDRLLRIGASIDPQRRRAVERMPDFVRLRGWVDRHFERWDAWARMAAQPPAKLLVITGEAHVGKSAVAKMLMERCCLCGHQIRYINLLGRTKLTYLDILMAIRNGVDDPESRGLTRSLADIAGNAFEAFDLEVSKALAIKAPQGELEIDQASLLKQERVMQPVFAAFTLALTQIASTERLVLVFDHMNEIGTDDFGILRQHLLDPFTGSPSSDVRLALILDNSDFETFAIGTAFRNSHERINVVGFSDTQLFDLMDEFVRRNYDMNLDANRTKKDHTEKVIIAMCELERLSDDEPGKSITKPDWFSSQLARFDRFLQRR